VKPKHILLAAGVLLLLATALGAFGVHALKPRLAAARFDAFENAVQYQFWQALGLFGIGLLARTHDSPVLRAAATLLLAGIVLFAGSIYAFTFGAPRAVVMGAPLGGTCLVLGWTAFIAAVSRLPATLR
jgi:uncharacterized membrane protein YgdD (TMEM256/DUF423 family)